MTEPSTSRLPAIPQLLDDGLLSGQHETTTVLRPERSARPVATDELKGALTEIEFACQVWGGGSQPLLPVCEGVLPEPYRRLLATEQIDFVGGLQEIELKLPTRVRARRPHDHPAILVAASEPPDKWRPVQVVALSAHDPWRPIYSAVLGTWPEAPDPQLLKFAFLREDLRFEEIVPVERVTAQGCLEDLIARTTDRGYLTPRTVANVFLAYGLRPDTSFMGHREDVLPNPMRTRRAAGPNLIVAVTPGSVEDLALLWNLRGAHGGSRVMPIGVPVEQLTPVALRELQEPGRATMFGLGGGACHLVSASVPLHELKELAAQSPEAQAVPYEAVLTVGPAPGRVHSHVSLWQDGKTRVDPMSDADREMLRESKAVRPPSLLIDVTVDEYPLPADPTMRGDEWFGRFQAGAAQVTVSELRDQQTVQVQWPSSWTCLAAAAQSRGFDIAPSEPGLAAATLVRALGSVDAIRLLQHRPLIALMYRMAERSGMSWWKKRWTTTHRELLNAGADPATLDKAGVLLGRDDPAVAPPGEGRAVPFQEFVAVLGGREAAAKHWVAWAERRHLLVRGSDVTCPGCRTKSWLPLAALPPPVPCAGCGRKVDQPYNPRELKFTYRLGEPLRRVLETDSLGHVLALHWFSQMFARAGLVGAYPGVTLTDPADKGKTVGEADVLLLFVDGRLVPVEVKRRLAGADDRTVQLMDALAGSLDARWDALVVTEPARDVPSLSAMERRLPDRPRVVLTADQLHAEHIFWAMGDNPFKWDPRTMEQDLERERRFSDSLSTNDPDVPWDRVAETLLDRNLGEPRGGADAAPGIHGTAETRGTDSEAVISDGEP
ncbi:MAG TPA: hypothetical protein VK988_05550 [Acidimicrobiales bacterium]|nr:hypothetical protein [Acidimicrobiales bacterium]